MGPVHFTLIYFNNRMPVVVVLIVMLTDFFFRTEMNSQIDNMQDHLDDLKDLLSGTQYQFDPTTILGVSRTQYQFDPTTILGVSRTCSVVHSINLILQLYLG